MSLLLNFLSKDEGEAAAEETTRRSVRLELLKRFFTFGGVSVGAAIVYGAIEILKNDPKDSFTLLLSWGPKAIGAIIAIVALYDLAKVSLHLVARLVQALERMATGLQKIGDKDDAQTREMQTLTSYTAQQSDRLNTQMSQVLVAVSALSEQVKELLEKR